MKMRTLIYLVACSCMPGFALLSLATAQEDKPQETLSDYSILWERNIFSQDRAPRREPTQRYTRPAPVYRPERDVVLRGVSQMDGRWVAFIENTRSGGTQRVRAGGQVARGRIKSVALDRIEYEAEGKIVEVAIGQTLEGSSSQPLVTYEPYEPGEEGPEEAAVPGDTEVSAGPASPAGDPDEEGLSLIERMRRRREQELSR